MRQILPFLSLILLINCQAEVIKSSGELEMEAKKVTDFQSNEADLNRAIIKIKEHLTPNELDSFYVSGIDKTEDSVRIILFHYDLIKQVNENKEKTDDEWVVLPPLSAMPDFTKEFVYLIKDDLIVNNSTK